MAAIHGGGLHIVADSSEGRLFAANRLPPSFSVFDLNGRIPALQFRGTYSPERRSIVLQRVESDHIEADMPQSALPNGSSIYGRIVDEANPEQMPDPASLAALAEAMTDGTGGVTLNSNIPAAYTYLGQLIAHDISKMEVADLECGPLNLRTSALDLDSVFGEVDNKLEPSPDTCWKDGLGLGKVSGNGGRYEDLPRTVKGEPVIPDQRNDNNLVVAQFHVAIIKFHRKVVSLFPTKSPVDCRTITLQHFQSIVLFDYLRQIIDPEVYADVIAHGRAVVHPHSDFNVDPFLLPVEFAAACFRFGHSMVRAAYQRWNDYVAVGLLGNLLGLTYLGGDLDQGRLPAAWVADWRRLSSEGDGQDHLKAAPVDTLLSQALFRLPPWMFPKKPEPGMPPTTNLAARTLMRGLLLRIPCAQQIATELNARLGKKRPQIKTLEDWEVADVANGWVKRILRAGDLGTPLMQRTPLWFYILRESEHSRLGGGRHLGPLASRIVMESIHSAIEATPGGILGATFKPRPELGGHPDRDFALPDLFACISET